MLPFWPVPRYCLTESFAILTIGSYKLIKASSSPLLKLGHYSKVSGDCRWDSSLLKTSRVSKESFALVTVCLLKIPMGNKDCSTIQGPLKRGLLYDSGTEKNIKVEKVNGLHGPLPRAFDTIAGKIDKSGDDYDTVGFDRHLFTWFLLVPSLNHMRLLAFPGYYPNNNPSGNPKLSKTCLMASKEIVLSSHAHLYFPSPCHWMDCINLHVLG